MLLFRYHDEQNPPFWSTAGGELKPGEDYRTAAQRELKEETGFDVPVSQFLREREDVYAVARSDQARWIEQYFLVECYQSDEPSRAGWTDEEHATIQDWKWWSLPDMRSEPELFIPKCLPDLLEASMAHNKGSSFSDA